MARVKINRRYGILNMDLTCSFCCDFEFSCLGLQGGGVCGGHQHTVTKNESK